MKYTLIIDHDPGAAFGVTVPDIPGCFSAGDTLEEAIANTSDAIHSHLQLLAEMGEDIPRAAHIDSHKDFPVSANSIWGFVDIDVAPYLGKTEKLTVTLPSLLVSRIDARYKNRSAFLTDAALRALNNG